MPDKPATKETLLIFVLLTTSMAHVLDFVIMMPLGPKLMAEFDMSAAKFGTIVSVYTVAAAFSSFFSILWVDFVDRKRALLMLLLGFSVGNAMCAFSPNIGVLILGRVLAGIFGGVMNAIVYSIMAQLISVERRGRAAGIIGTAFPVVSILGVPFGLKLADMFGWRSSFTLVFAMSFVALFLGAVALPRVAPSGGPRRSIREMVVSTFTYQPHRVGVVLMMVTVLGGFTIVPYIAPFLIQHEFIAEAQLYLVFLVGGTCSIVSARLIGGLTDRYGKVPVLRWVVVVAILAVAVFTNLPMMPLMGVLAASSFLMVFLPGRFVCVMAYLTIIGHPETRGTFMSLVSTIQQLTIGAAAIIGGFLVGEAGNGRFETYWLAGLFAIGANALILVATPYLARLEKDGMRLQAIS